MIAALATLVFLAAILCIAGIGAMIWEESRGRIAAALRGQPLLPCPAPGPAPLRFRPRARSQRPLRAEARWSAAA